MGLRAGKIKKIEQFLLNNRKTDDLCHVFLATELEECATRPDDGELIEDRMGGRRRIRSADCGGRSRKRHYAGSLGIFQSKSGVGLNAVPRGGSQ